MTRLFLYIHLLILLVFIGCKKDNFYSDDLLDSSLLPPVEDYDDTDFGTQDLAHEIAQALHQDSLLITLVIYDEETRTEQLLSLTGSRWPANFEAQENGALKFNFQDFQTELMPLKMSTAIQILLEADKTQDTIWLTGYDGIVQTKVGEDATIGTPTPESDDAELSGYYIRSQQKVSIIYDLMLPIAFKAHIKN